MATRQGVCSGLKEVLENVSRQQLAEHLGVLLPLVQGALLDADPAVRQVPILLMACCIFRSPPPLQPVSILSCKPSPLRTPHDAAQRCSCARECRSVMHARLHGWEVGAVACSPSIRLDSRAHAVCAVRPQGGPVQ